MRYDIYNPTTHGRVIYDGITNAKGIFIGAGETKHEVELADHIADGFNCSPTEDKSDLILTCLDEQPWRSEAEPTTLKEYVRYQAPSVETIDVVAVVSEPPKRKRSRPRKNPISIGD